MLGGVFQLLRHASYSLDSIPLDTHDGLMTYHVSSKGFYIR